MDWAFIFANIFSFVRRAPSIREGLRYGFCMGLLFSLPKAFNTYAVMPVPFELSLGWLACGVGQDIICGAVVALVYKPKGDAA